MSFPRTRQETTAEAIATLVQAGHVAQKTSWAITQEILDLLEQEAELRGHDPRSEL